MANLNDVDRINQMRLKRGGPSTPEDVRTIRTVNQNNLGIANVDYYEQLIFKVRAELNDYIVHSGLVDGLIWDGQLKPVVGGKIIITSEMIRIITDRFGYLREQDAIDIIMNILITGNYVQDENYVHTDNNYTDEEKDKLAGLEDGSEVNKVNDVIFNGESVVADTIATITITPEMVKEWYESNPNTNAFTDADLDAVRNGLPAAIADETERATAREDELQGMVEAEADRAVAAESELDEKITAEINRASAREEELDNKINAETIRATTEEGRLDEKIDELAEDVSIQLGGLEAKVDNEATLNNQRYDETTRRFTEQGELLVQHSERIAVLESRADQTDSRFENYYTKSESDIKFADDFQYVADPYAGGAEIALTVNEWITRMNSKNFEQDDELKNLNDRVDDIHRIFTLRGSVQNYSDLPTADVYDGDVYIVLTDETHEGHTSLYTYSEPETAFIYVARLDIDLSLYYTSEEVDQLLLAVNAAIGAIDTRLNTISVTYGDDTITGTIEEIVQDLYEKSHDSDTKLKEDASVYEDFPTNTQLSFKGDIDSAISFVLYRMLLATSTLQSRIENNETQIQIHKNYISNIGQYGSVIIEDSEGNVVYNGILNGGLTYLLAQINQVDVETALVTATRPDMTQSTLTVRAWIEELLNATISVDVENAIVNATMPSGVDNAMSVREWIEGIYIDIEGINAEIENQFIRLDGKIDDTDANVANIRSDLTDVEGRLNNFSLNNAGGTPVITGTVEQVSQWLYNYASTEFASDRDRLDELEKYITVTDFELKYDFAWGRGIRRVFSTENALNQPGDSEVPYYGIYIANNETNGSLYIQSGRSDGRVYARTRYAGDWQQWVRLDNVESGSANVKSIEVTNYNTWTPPEEEGFYIISAASQTIVGGPMAGSYSASGYCIVRKHGIGNVPITGMLLLQTANVNDLSNTSTWQRMYKTLSGTTTASEWVRLDNVDGSSFNPDTYIFTVNGDYEVYRGVLQTHINRYQEYYDSNKVYINRGTVGTNLSRVSANQVYQEYYDYGVSTIQLHLNALQNINATLGHGAYSLESNFPSGSSRVALNAYYVTAGGRYVNIIAFVTNTGVVSIATNDDINIPSGANIHISGTFRCSKI